MSIVIDKIVFKNYRQYGTGSLSFRSDDSSKLSVLIAKNGTGKTTLLNAITWCLYGKELHLADDMNPLPILNTAVARTLAIGERGVITDVSVTLRIIDKTSTIEFKRERGFTVSSGSHGGPYKCTESATRFYVSVTPRCGLGNTRIYNGNDAQLLVKKYFDETIFKFYFFDGEKLRDFFDNRKSDIIRQSIFNISQVTMLEKVCVHLEKMLRERRKKLAKDCPKLDDLSDEREKLEERLTRALASLADRREEAIKLTRKQKELDDVLRNYEPIKKLQQERQALEATLNKIKEEEELFRSDRSAFIRKYYVLLTLYPRIKHTLDMIDSKEADGDLPPAIDKDQVRRLLAHLDEPCPLCNGVIGETGREHLESLLERISVSSRTSHYLKEIKGSLEDFTKQAKRFNKELADIHQREIDIKTNKEKADDRLQQISKLLSNYADESGQLDVAKIESDRTCSITRLGEANRAIGIAEATIASCNERLSEIEDETNRALRTISEHADIRKQLDVIEILHGQFRKIKTQIVDEMKLEIEKTTWAIFDSMIWKKQTFGSIQIDESYNVAVFNIDGVEMTGSLSATEQMALAYAFTLAIHKASGKNCPLVIDSPLGRVSDDNRENMARALQEISQDKQIIMLFTPDEYSASVRAMYDGSAEVRELSLSEDESHVEGIEG